LEIDKHLAKLKANNSGTFLPDMVYM